MSVTSQPILIVEDNPTARKMFRLTLEAEGYRVLEAVDGRSALAQLATELPALVLQDLVLPDYDGFELCRAMRSIAGCADLPIVVMSGFPRLLDRARSEPGCFNASLVKPLVPSLLVEVVRRYAVPSASNHDTFGRGRTILIIDDEPVQLKLTRLRFSEVGFDVAVASDGPTAIALAKANPPDIVVCDVLMPGTDGYELCVSFREVPELAKIPFILVSAHFGGESDEALARSAGANALVTRGPMMEEVFAAVRTHIEQAAAIPAKDPAFEDHHAKRVIAQLRRQARANAGIAERAALQAAQLSVLAGLADALARSGNLEDALGDVLAASLNSGGITRGALFRLDAQRRHVLSFASGFPETSVRELADLFGFAKLLDNEHAAVITPHDVLAPDDAATLRERIAADTIVLVPIFDGTSRAGWLLLGTSIPEIDAQDLSTFGRAVGSHVAQALALTEAFTRLKDAAEASRVLSASLDVRKTQASLGQLATAQLAELCEIRIGGEPPAVYVASNVPPQLSKALERLRRRYPAVPVLSSEVDHGDEHRELRDALALGAVTVLPLVAGDHHLGTIAFARTRGSRPFRAADTVAMEDLTCRAAIAIDNARLYETARAANRSKDEFLATVSHELRAPLNAMLGWAQLLKGGLPPTKQESAIEAIERNAFAQAALVDDLLDMSRIVSGTMRLEVETVELGTIVEAAIDSVRPRLLAKQVVLLPFRQEGSHRVIGDPNRLHQIVCNVLNNAIKFTPAKGHVGIALGENDHGSTLTISDDGAGIDKGFLEHVFERFKQADGSTSRAHGGLGLGLAITRHLVELHGGTIAVASDGPGRGATFMITLPHAAREPAKLPHRSEPVPKMQTALDGLSILVVDDEADAREMIVALLEYCGAVTTSACGAHEALEAVIRARPDVVLSDIGMPGEDGYSLIKKIRLLPQCGTLPAIAVSGFAGVEDRRQAMAAGFHAHLAKPVKLDDLLSTIVKFAASAR
jgi:CheY-like chemotaxis protein